MDDVDHSLDDDNQSLLMSFLKAFIALLAVYALVVMFLLINSTPI